MRLDSIKPGRVAALVTFACVGALAVDPAVALVRSGRPTSTIAPLLGCMLLSVGMMTFAAWLPRFSMALGAAAAWSFTFLGLAASYNVAGGGFYWGGVFADAAIARGAWVALIGVSMLFAPVVLRRVMHSDGPDSFEPANSADVNEGALRSLLVALCVVQVVATLVLVAAVGLGGISSGKTAFKAALATSSGFPGIGTSYFMATALGIILPSILLWSRRFANMSMKGMLVLSLGAAVVATNPLIGSRFLTGSFLVATVSAALGGSALRRLLPLGTVLALVFLFPSLDLWRGDGSGAEDFRLESPKAALAAGDFDAFEMLLRAVTVQDSDYVSDQHPMTQAGSALFYWMPLQPVPFPKIGSGTIIAEATGMSHTNVSMPLPAEGYLLAGWIGTLAACGLVGLWLRNSCEGLMIAHKWAVGPADAAIAGLLFIVLRGSIMSVLDYLLLAVFLGWLVGRRIIRLPDLRKSNQHAQQA